jgi:hypothetical protein
MTSYTKYINNVVDEPTVFELRVRTVNVTGVPSAWHYGDITFDGHQDAPIDLQYLNVTVTDSVANLEWNRITDTKASLELRHTSVLDDAKWSDGTQIKTLSYAAVTTTTPHKIGTYMMKAVRQGMESPNHVAAVSTIEEKQLNELQEFIQHVEFAGSHWQTEVVDDVLQLMPEPFLIELNNGDTLITNTGDDILVTNSYTVPEQGIYNFASGLTLAEIGSVTFKSILDSEDLSLEDLVDARVPFMDSWTEFDSLAGGSVTKEIQVRTRNDISETGDWQTLVDGVEMTGLAFDFRLVLTSPMQNTNVRVSKLGVTANVPDRTARGFGIETDATGIHTVTFDKPFRRPPFLGISAHDLVGSFEISNITLSGFTVTFVDVNDAPITTTFNYQATGF